MAVKSNWKKLKLVSKGMGRFAFPILNKETHEVVEFPLEGLNRNHFGGLYKEGFDRAKAIAELARDKYVEDSDAEWAAYRAKAKSAPAKPTEPELAPVDMTLFSEAWYESVRALDWRSRFNKEPTLEEKRQHYVETTLSAMGIEFVFKSMRVESGWGKAVGGYTFFFSSDKIGVDDLKKLMQISFYPGGGLKFVFANVTAETYSEGGYGHDEEYVESTYSRVAVHYTIETKVD